MAKSRQRIPTPALVLGLAGLLPFFISAYLSFSADVKSSATGLLSLGAYGAVILSFLGGIRWGLVLNNKAQVQKWAPLMWSVVPSLIAWPALLLPSRYMLLVLVAGLLFQYAMDNEAVKVKKMPNWFGRLRLILTTGAVLLLIAGLLSTIV